MECIEECAGLGLRVCAQSDVVSLQHSIINHVEYTLARSRYRFDDFEAYQATALSIRDRLIESWNDTQVTEALWHFQGSGIPVRFPSNLYMAQTPTNLGLTARGMVRSTKLAMVACTRVVVCALLQAASPHCVHFPSTGTARRRLPPSKPTEVFCGDFPQSSNISHL